MSEAYSHILICPGEVVTAGAQIKGFAGHCQGPLRPQDLCEHLWVEGILIQEI